MDGTRDSYDAVAATYAARFGDELDGKPLDRALLAAYSETVAGPVADLGCGPGHVTAHLSRMGLEVTGIDLSPAMIDTARTSYPGLSFAVGDMTRLDLGSGSLGGIVAFYSIIHLPDELLPVAFAEFARVLVPGGQLLVAFQVGDDERLHLVDWHGHRVELDHHRRRPDTVADLLTAAGLDVRARLVREPEPGESADRCYLLARRRTG